MIDKDYCMSSYLAFRYIHRPDIDFAEGLKHEYIPAVRPEEQALVHNAEEISNAVQKVFDELKKQYRLGIMLSGGMDSACLASYMRGMDAYTFRFLGGEIQTEELARAEYYAKYYELNLHYVDITWDVAEKYLPACMKAKSAPVHSIEPQILAAAEQAKADGITCMIVGESADLLFGGMDQLLSKDWTFDEFEKRYTFTRPEQVLRNPISMQYVYEQYRQGENIDFLRFMDEIFSIESSSSYYNAFGIAGLKYCDPYAKLKMADELDLYRVRHGEPKYLIRELFSMKYPEMAVPDKNPMPRPVDKYFEHWAGPTRPEFLPNLDMTQFTGNQKWQLWCLEQFLNSIDKYYGVIK